MSCSEWKEYKLEDLIINYNSKRKPLSSRERENRKGIYPYYGAQGIIDYLDDYIFDGEYLLIAEDGNNLKERKEDIARIAKGKFWVNNHAHIITNNELSDMRFLKYYINTLDISAYITGSAQPKLNKANLSNIKIKAPSLEEQKKIADILSSLDDKIELNNEMNKTLEEMAQSIFKRWFVDFEFPNENGEPYKSSGGEMIESELGMVPKGWEVGSFSDISEILDSKRIPLSKREREKRANIYPYYGAASLMDYVDDYIFEGIHVLMGEDGTVIDKDGFPILQYVGGKFWVNNHAHVLKGKNEFSNEFVYLYLSNTNVTHLVTGAVQPKINQKNLTSLKLPIPDKNMTVKFNSLAKNIFEYIYKIRQENKKLEEIRSILLPVLMNGTINIK